ncbi:tryptophan synthase subunit alpha, partial [bacterium]|nr:tryptophan synthase subunit alpha [bacterium]
MNKIDEKFKYLEEKNEKALILYFTAGFPSFDKSIEIIKNAEKYGADIIEIGVPFSDPIADGPIIQYTSYEALRNGMNLKKVFELCKLLKNEIQIPYLLMSYYNPIF